MGYIELEGPVGSAWPVSEGTGKPWCGENLRNSAERERQVGVQGLRLIWK